MLLVLSVLSRSYALLLRNVGMCGLYGKELQPIMLNVKVASEIYAQNEVTGMLFHTAICKARILKIL